MTSNSEPLTAAGPAAVPKGRSPAPEPVLRAASILLLVCFAVALRLPLASIPFERDEGGYAYIAWRWLLGEIPYATVFEQKAPGVFFAYAVLQALGARSPAAIHWAAAALQLPALVCAGWLSVRLCGSRIGFGAAFLLAFLLADRAFLGQAANTETFMVAALGPAVYLAWTAAEDGGGLTALAAGILFGAAAAIKPSAAAELTVCLGLLAWKRRLREALCLSLGLLVVPIGFLAVFAAHHALRPLVDDVFLYNASYVGRLSLEEALWNLRNTGGPLIASTWPLLALAGVAIFRRGRQATFAVLWLGAGLAGACLGGRFREHYFLQAAPGLALLAAMGLASLRLDLRRSTALAAACLAAGMLAHLDYWLPTDPLDKARAIYGHNPFAPARDVARLVASLSCSGDSVFILGSEPEFLYESRRKSATRHLFMYPLTDGTEAATLRQREMLSDLKAARPLVVVTVFQATSIHERGKIDPLLFVGVREALREGQFEVAGVIPFETEELVVGAEAADLWQRGRFWYGDPHPWASLAIWRRPGAQVSCPAGDVAP